MSKMTKQKARKEGLCDTCERWKDGYGCSIPECNYHPLRRNKPPTNDNALPQNSPIPRRKTTQEKSEDNDGIPSGKVVKKAEL